MRKIILGSTHRVHDELGEVEAAGGHAHQQLVPIFLPEGVQHEQQEVDGGYEDQAEVLEAVGAGLWGRLGAGR